MLSIIMYTHMHVLHDVINHVVPSEKGMQSPGQLFQAY